MKALFISTYLCSGFMGLLPCTILVEWFVNPDNEALNGRWLMFAIWLFPCITQIVYTYRTSRILNLSEFKPTQSLDDYMMNDMEITDEVINHGFWLKGFAIMNSLMLCFYFLMTFSSIKNYIGMLFENNTGSEISYLLVRILLLIFAIPAVIFNLRTFNISRIRRVQA